MKKKDKSKGWFVDIYDSEVRVMNGDGSGTIAEVRGWGRDGTGKIQKENAYNISACMEMKAALLEVIPHLNQLPAEVYQRLAPLCHASIRKANNEI